MTRHHRTGHRDWGQASTMEVRPLAFATHIASAAPRAFHSSSCARTIGSYGHSWRHRSAPSPAQTAAIKTTTAASLAWSRFSARSSNTPAALPLDVILFILWFLCFDVGLRWWKGAWQSWSFGAIMEWWSRMGMLLEGLWMVKSNGDGGRWWKCMCVVREKGEKMTLEWIIV